MAYKIISTKIAQVKLALQLIINYLFFTQFQPTYFVAVARSFLSVKLLFKSCSSIGAVKVSTRPLMLTVSVCWFVVLRISIKFSFQISSWSVSWSILNVKFLFSAQSSMEATICTKRFWNFRTLSFRYMSEL